MTKASETTPAKALPLGNCDSVVLFLVFVFFFSCISHTLMITFTTAISDDSLLTLVWEEITLTVLIMLTSLGIYELFIKTN